MWDRFRRGEHVQSPSREDSRGSLCALVARVARSFQCRRRFAPAAGGIGGPSLLTSPGFILPGDSVSRLPAHFVRGNRGCPFESHPAPHSPAPHASPTSPLDPRRPSRAPRTLTGTRRRATAPAIVRSSACIEHTPSTARRFTDEAVGDDGVGFFPPGFSRSGSRRERSERGNPTMKKVVV